MGDVAASQIVLPGPVPVLEDEKGEQEASVLDAVVHLSALLPAGWHAEVGPGSVVLSWRAG